MLRNSFEEKERVLGENNAASCATVDAELPNDKYTEGQYT